IPANLPPTAHNPLTAGDLLHKSHEELVLLLIQLRRQSAGLLRAMEVNQAEMDRLTQALSTADPMVAGGPGERERQIRRYHELLEEQRELELQYDGQKPLIHLVDNMVKLGSLYNRPNRDLATGASGPAAQAIQSNRLREKIDFFHRIQERRMVEEERRQWEKENTSQQEIERMITSALESVKAKLLTVVDPYEAERLRNQQRKLEGELRNVRTQLLHSSKRLEEAETENARLEHELMVLRQKVLRALKHATNLQSHNIAAKDLEDELQVRKVMA
ncbi:unnamed protein product, partial [Cyprideis torosa]